MKLTKLISRIVQKRLIHRSTMANSRYEYVKSFETDDKILQNCWIVIRIDGNNFHKFADTHEFEKPNDERALNLMNHAASLVMNEYNEIVISYGQSDEYSFVFHKSAKIYNRRSAKIMSNVNSLFTASYIFHWSKWFKNQPLKYPPSFDARVVLYPSDENLRDYLSWRQADVHINNLYNTAFWNLVQVKGLSNADAEKTLRGTFAADKNEILFKEFGINYNNVPAIFRKGTILLKKQITLPDNSKRKVVIPIYDDLIRDKFWKEHDELLEKKLPKMYEFENNKIPEIVLDQINN